MFENDPIDPVVYVFLVTVLVPNTFVVLSQSLNRKMQDPRLAVVQFHTVIQTLPTGVPPAALA